MNTHRISSALLTIGLCSASVLAAQSTVPRDPPGGSPLGGINPRLTPLRATVAMNQGPVSALAYLYGHPLSTSPNPVRGRHPGTFPPVASETIVQAERRPECPMPVATSIVQNDSMPVQRIPARNVEPMPVAPSRCTNPLGTKH